MQLVIMGEPYPQNVEKMLFLADSTFQQDKLNSSWRMDAIQWLEQLGYDGIVYIPEDREGSPTNAVLDDEARIRWTHGAQMRSDVIVFWLPADIKSSSDIVTGVELGWLMASGRIILAMPSETEKVRDLRLYAQQFGVPYYTTLSKALDEAVKRIGVGAQRYNGESAVPLAIWRTESFQEWLTAQKKAGNRLDDAHVEWIGRVGSKGDMVFFWIMFVKVWIQDENRYKENEWIIGRPNISSILLYMPHPTDPMETKIVLVKEYRSPVSNSQAKIYELPGGSTFEAGMNPYTLAMQELQEETGFTLGEDHKLRSHVPRQLNGTLSTHKCHLFSLELTPKEMSDIEEVVGKTFGNSEDTERTTLVVMSLGELLRADYADYATIGMIMQSIADNAIIR
jgi:8-oxo-dGTP pyrophosphatase MutT (NUDIX family)